MPMRKHEMVYVFYEKLPFYDLSSHKHKFIKHKEGQIKPPTKSDNSPYGGESSRKKQLKLCVGGQAGSYDPPLPVSVVKEEKTQISQAHDKDLYGASNGGTIGNVHGTNYDPPLPVSVVKEESGGATGKEDYETCNKPHRKTMYGDMEIFEPKRRSEPRYEPPLPTSMFRNKINKRETLDREAGRPDGVDSQILFQGR